jgi:hypothetical protein
MRLPRVRLTLKRMMIAVAVAATGLAGGLEATRLVRISINRRDRAAFNALNETMMDTFAQSASQSARIQEQLAISYIDASDRFASRAMEKWASNLKRTAEDLRQGAANSKRLADDYRREADRARTLKLRYERAALRPWLPFESAQPRSE